MEINSKKSSGENKNQTIKKCLSAVTNNKDNNNYNK